MDDLPTGLRGGFAHQFTLRVFRRIGPSPVKGHAKETGILKCDECGYDQQMNAQTIDTKLLELLVCPVTKGPLELSANKQELISKSAKLAYPIKDGMPIMLEVQARVLSQEECER